MTNDSIVWLYRYRLNSKGEKFMPSKHPALIPERAPKWDEAHLWRLGQSAAQKNQQKKVS